MKRFIILVVMLLSTATTTALAGSNGRTCTNVQGTSQINPECSRDGGGVDIIYFQYTLCENSSHKGTCDNKNIVCASYKWIYISSGKNPCAKVISKTCQEIYACSGVPIPIGKGWIYDAPLTGPPP